VKNVEAKQRPYRDLAFFADSMHGSLARKLRIFGIDTAYSRSISDEHLLRECNEQQRILLTSDRELFKRSLNKRIGSLLLNCRSDKENLVKILGLYNIRKLRFDAAYARCPMCNTKLERKTKYEIDGLSNLIPQKSYFIYTLFYQCSGCRRIYWEGSHKSALVSLAESVTRELYQMS
jgi:uncharacterized protein with PIN domain